MDSYEIAKQLERDWQQAVNDGCKCDGETAFGYTTKPCDKQATQVLRNGTYEFYAFCDEHAYRFRYGSSSKFHKHDNE